MAHDQFVSDELSEDRRDEVMDGSGAHFDRDTMNPRCKCCGRFKERDDAALCFTCDPGTPDGTDFRSAYHKDVG